MTTKKLEVDEHTRFLVVDDDPLVRQTVIEYLASMGMTKVREASNGPDAIAELKTGLIDFVISDWEMPGVSGLDVLRMLRSDPVTAQVPFVMMTSPISHERIKVEEAALAQVDAYLIKPFRAGMLKQKIAETVENRAIEGRKGALVVDDDDAVRETVVEILQSMGHDPIFQARDGEEGYELLKQHVAVIEIVVSDWEMPKMQGIELLKKVRVDKELSKTPFIMCTSQQSIERIKLRKAIEAEVDQYLLKPFTAQALRDKVLGVIKEAKLIRQVEGFLTSAMLAVSDRNWGDAERAFHHALKLDGRNIQALLGMAQVELNREPKRNYEQAIKLIRKAITINPRMESPRIALAQAFESAMSLEKAIASIRESFQFCPFSDALHYELGRLLIRRNRVEEGQAELRKALELNPDNQDAKDLLGMKTEE